MPASSEYLLSSVAVQVADPLHSGNTVMVQQPAIFCPDGTRIFLPRDCGPATANELLRQLNSPNQRLHQEIQHLEDRNAHLSQELHEATERVLSLETRLEDAQIRMERLRERNQL